MDFDSQELKNATLVKSSLTDNTITNNINMEQIKQDLRLFVLSKDRSLINLYDICNMNKCNNISSNDVLKSILNVLRDYYSNKFRLDNNKNLTIRKTFDIMLLCLDTLSINGSDLTANEVNTILLSFLNKNFL